LFNDRVVIPGSVSPLSPSSAAFILVSFEGPDSYSSAGGLGVRVSSLADTLAQRGYETHLFFVGDPSLPGEEILHDGRLILHRWGQWLSACHPGGVYDGENAKMLDLTRSLPRHLADRIISPIVSSGKIAVVLSEEWQTAQAAIDLSDKLHELGMRDRALLFWNANNPYSFERIDWARLAFTNHITTVSRYMRSIIRARGVDAIVIPNGIPSRLIGRGDSTEAESLRATAAGRLLYFKMARWEQEKGWSQALDAMLELKKRGRKATLIARSGGPTGKGSGLHADALARGLNSCEVHGATDLIPALTGMLRSGADVINLRFGVTETLAQTFFAACDGVLANSISEPFGLVGLEAMAAGGVVYTGGTGEDYAVSGKNAVVLETLDAGEIADRSVELAAAPERVARMRRAAMRTARDFTWDKVSSIVLARAANAVSPCSNSLRRDAAR
jgi:glycosyltransferase involved in cell wall biosynthesis